MDDLGLRGGKAEGITAVSKGDIQPGELAHPESINLITFLTIFSHSRLHLDLPARRASPDKIRAAATETVISSQRGVYG